MTEVASNDLAADIVALKGLGAACIKLLKEAVEHGEVKRSKLPKAAPVLQDAGFLIVRESNDPWSKEVTLSASMLGWEVVDALLDEEDNLRESIRKPTRGSRAIEIDEAVGRHEDSPDRPKP